MSERVSTMKADNSVRLARYLTETTGRNSVPLFETTLHRVFSRHAADGYFIISASRKIYGDDENRRRTDYLEADIRALKRYSYLPVTGGFIETYDDPDKPGEKISVEVTERAFLCMSRHPLNGNAERMEYTEAMLDDAKMLCGKYEQDDVLVQVPGNPPQYLTAAGAVDMTFDGDPSLNNVAKVYFTKLHRGGDSKPSDMGSHGRWSFRDRAEQREDEAKLGLATYGPSATIAGNHVRMANGDLSEEINREHL